MSNGTTGSPGKRRNQPLFFFLFNQKTKGHSLPLTGWRCIVPFLLLWLTPQHGDLRGQLISNANITIWYHSNWGHCRSSGWKRERASSSCTRRSQRTPWLRDWIMSSLRDLCAVYVYPLGTVIRSRALSMWTLLNNHPVSPQFRLSGMWSARAARLNALQRRNAKGLSSNKLGSVVLFRCSGV